MTRLKEVRPAHVYTRIPFDVYRGTVGLFMLEVTRNSIKEAEENPALFSFLYEAFRSFPYPHLTLPTSYPLS